jgi:hypothetical protein
MRDPRYKFANQCEDKGIKDHNKLIISLYKDKNKSCNEISEIFFSTYEIAVTPRTISELIKKNGLTRDKKTARLISISTGRMTYHRKNDEEKKSRKNISHFKRVFTLSRDNFSCQLCGKGRIDGRSLEIHHKDFDSDNNETDNLQTLCFSCHRGAHKMKIYEDAKESLDTKLKFGELTEGEHTYMLKEQFNLLSK